MRPAVNTPQVANPGLAQAGGPHGDLPTRRMHVAPARVVVHAAVEWDPYSGSGRMDNALDWSLAPGLMQVRDLQAASRF